MKLIVGLGNPGRTYKKNRHNLGFLALDSVAHHCKVKIAKRKFNALHTVVTLGGEQIVLVKPLTFMNLSGKAVRSFIDYYDIDFQHDLLVIVDDVHLSFGKMRIRKQGSAGGHNGLHSIIVSLETPLFARLRVGIDKPLHEGCLTSHVLGNFSKEEAGQVPEILEAVKEVIVRWCEKGTAACM